jgi:4-oxalocrotonate tautomerase family enzyme
MPFIEFHIASGLSDSSKRKLLQQAIEVVHEAIDDDPKLVNVVLHEYPKLNLMVSGRIDGQTRDGA